MLELRSKSLRSSIVVRGSREDYRRKKFKSDREDVFNLLGGFPLSNINAFREGQRIVGYKETSETFFRIDTSRSAARVYRLNLRTISRKLRLARRKVGGSSVISLDVLRPYSREVAVRRTFILVTERATFLSYRGGESRAFYKETFCRLFHPAPSSRLILAQRNDEGTPAKSSLAKVSFFAGRIDVDLLELS